ncbi:VOC family protein [Olivibacter sp. CPCC 100613]|uniref:VOC family protein n=1 Tax=Olivibacter sp. CPCC 100613 TaxID=3079931 RepID=UPI002FF6EFFB
MRITGILLASFFFFGTGLLRAQQKNTLKLNHIAVYVENLQKSTAFYKDVLQLTEIPEPFHDGLHTWFTIGAAGSLHLIQGAKGGIERDKNDHLCFSTNDIQTFIHNLENRQITYFDWPGKKGKVTTRVDGVHQIYFRDPDGHWIEINDEK